MLLVDEPLLKHQLSFETCVVAVVLIQKRMELSVQPLQTQKHAAKNISHRHDSPRSLKLLASKTLELVQGVPIYFAPPLEQN